MEKHGPRPCREGWEGLCSWVCGVLLLVCCKPEFFFFLLPVF